MDPKLITPEEFKALSKDEQAAMLKGFAAIQAGQEQIVKEERGVSQLNMKELNDMVADTVRKAIEPMTKVDRKHFAFPGTGKVVDDLTPEGKYAKTTKFFKALWRGEKSVLWDMENKEMAGWSEKAKLNEGTGSAGGYLVPEEFKAEILRLAPLFGVIRRNVRIIPMLYDVLNIPAAGSQNVTTSWVNEAGTITSTDPNFRQITLTIKKLAAIPKVTSELLADANVGVLDYLAEIIAEAMAEEEDEQGFNGTGSPFVGVLKGTGFSTTAQAGGTAAQSLSYTDTVNVTGSLYQNVLSGAKWYFHRTMVAHLKGLITTTGAPIFDTTTQTLHGFPIEWVEKLPAKTAAVGATTPYAVFGDMRRTMAMGERGSMRMKLTDVGVVGADNLFEQDMSALRVIERVCLGTLLPSASNIITTGA